MSAALELRNFGVEINVASGATIQPVEGVDLTVGAGERVALVGESGCGKSMLLRGVLQFFPRDVLAALHGEAVFDGTDLTGLKGAKLLHIRGNRIGLIFQDALARLNPTMRIGKQIEEVLEDKDRRVRAKKVASVMRAIGLDDSPGFLRRYPHELSGGMRQRVLIAISLVADPEMLIADEPTTALDVTVQAQIMDLITTVVSERKMALMVVTHDLGIVAESCDFVYVMYAGQIVESGTVREVFEHPEHPYTRGLLACVLEINEHASGEVSTIPGVVPAPGTMTQGCRFRNRCPLVHERCLSDPPLRQLGDRRAARCWLAGETLPLGKQADTSASPVEDATTGQDEK